MVYITKTFEFSCAHFPLEYEEESGVDLQEYFSQEIHGHNYLLEVTLRGPVDEVSGMVINLSELKQIVQDRVIQIFDHRLLNTEVRLFQKKPPTTENIAIEIWKLLDGYFPKGKLSRIRLHESRDFYVEYFGTES